MALLAVAGWGTLALWNWVTTESVEEQRAGDLSSPLKVEGLTSFVVRKDGQKYWAVAADSAQVVEGGNAWLASGVSKGVLFRDDQPWITMSAPRVRYSNVSKNLDAVGGVKARGPENFSFETPQARWLEQKKLVEIPGAVRAHLREMEFAMPNLGYQWEKGELQSPGPVEVRVKGGVLRGRQMTTNINTRVVTLGRDVELIFTPGVAQLPRPFASPAPSSAPKPAGFRLDAPTSPLALASYDATAARSTPMFRSRLLSPILALAAASAPAAILVQAPPAPAAPAAKTGGDVEILGGKLSYSDANGVSVLNGGVTLREVGKEFELTASAVTYNGPQNQASARGNLKVETTNSTIRGAQLFGDFNKKLLSISGNVVISAYDKGNGMNSFRSTQARKPVRIACNRLDWNYTTRQATLVGNLRIVQADNSGTCDTIIFDEPNNVVTLKGNVRFGNSKNQQFIGDEVTIYVDKGIVKAPNVLMRSRVDSASSSAKTPATKPAPPIVFPKQNSAAPGIGNVELPKAPPPIETLVPKSTPLVRVKPTLPPLPAPKADSKAPPAPDEAQKDEADGAKSDDER